MKSALLLTLALLLSPLAAQAQMETGDWQTIGNGTTVSDTVITQLPAWQTCQSQTSNIFDSSVCLAKAQHDSSTALKVTEAVLQQVQGWPITADRDAMRQRTELEARIFVTEARIYAAAGNPMGVYYSARMADDAASSWGDDLLWPVHGVTEPLLWDALSKDEQSVLTAHGGTRTDNVDARPSEWKTDDAHTYIWIYKAMGAVQKVYTFKGGKLVSAVAP